MTCIVGIEHEGVVYMGGDSAGVEEESLFIQTYVDEKVFVNGDMIMGFTHSFRMGQLLRYALEIPDSPSRKDDMHYLVTDFIDAIRNLYRDKGFLQKENEADVGGSFLVGYNGKLYSVEEDFHVARVHDGMSAIGCGSSYALGSLYESKGNITSPKDRIKRALETATHFSAGVRPPFHIISSAENE